MNEPNAADLKTKIGPAVPETERTVGAETIGVALGEQKSLPQGNGDFEFLNKVAEGGMGAVWRVRDVRMNRTLAIKLLREDLAGSAEAVERFRAEAMICGQLSHPGVVPVHEVGVLPDGRHFFTMKLVEGETLAGRLGKRDANEGGALIAVFEQICQAVAFAHQNNVIHRDLKPANIMIGAFGETQVMDWGLAKVLGEDEEFPGEPADVPGISTDRDGSLTQPGAAMGTLAYMPPEQARGAVEEIDSRSDVFGLGAILCEILTGSAPYSADSALELYQCAQEARLDSALSRIDECDADPALKALALSCLSERREDRPENAAKLAEVVTEYRRQLQQRLQQERMERERQEVRAIEERKRRRLTMLLALTVLVATGIGGAWAFYDQQRKADARQAAALFRQDVEKDLKFVGQQLESEQYVAAEATLAQLSKRLGADAPADLLEEMKALKNEAGLIPQLREINEEVRAATSYSAIAKAVDRFLGAMRKAGFPIDPDDPKAIQRIANSRIEAAMLRSIYLAALERGLTEETGFDRPDKDNALRIGRTLVLLETGLRVQGLETPAKLVALRRAGLKEKESKPTLLKILRAVRGKFELGRATPELRLLMAMPDTDLAERLKTVNEGLAAHPRSTSLNLAMSAALIPLEQNDRSAGYARVAAVLAPHSATAQSFLGGALFRSGYQAEGMRWIRRAVAMAPKVPLHQLNLATALVMQGRSREAIAALKGIANKFEGDNKAAVLNNLAQAHYSLAEMKQAVSYYRDAHRESPGNWPALAHVARLSRESGQYKDALRACEELIRSKDQIPHAVGAIEKARTLFCQRKFDEALGILKTILPKIPPGTSEKQTGSTLLGHLVAIAKIQKNLDAHIAGKSFARDLPTRLAVFEFCVRTRRWKDADRAFGACTQLVGTRLLQTHPEALYDMACAAIQESTQTNVEAQKRIWFRKAGMLLQALMKMLQQLGPRKVGTNTTASEMLARWKSDPALFPIRDDEELKKLPEDLQKQWRTFWKAVDAGIKAISQ